MYTVNTKTTTKKTPVITNKPNEEIKWNEKMFN